MGTVHPAVNGQLEQVNDFCCRFFSKLAMRKYVDYCSLMHCYHDPLPRKDRAEAKKRFEEAGFADAENIAWMLSLTMEQRFALLREEAESAKYLGIAA